MGLRPNKATPAQNRISRLALIVAGLLMLGLGAALLRLAWRSLVFLSDQSVRADLRVMCVPLIAGGFLSLAGLLAVGFACLPRRERRYGPPRGWVLISRTMDVFWAAATGGRYRNNDD